MTRSLRPGIAIAEIYGGTTISERHRHRYEVNIDYKERLEACGLVFAGMSPGRRAAGNGRISRPSMVHRRAVSPGTEEPPVRAASAVCQLHCRGHGAEPAGVGGGLSSPQRGEGYEGPVRRSRTVGRSWVRGMISPALPALQLQPALANCSPGLRILSPLGRGKLPLAISPFAPICGPRGAWAG